MKKELELYIHIPFCARKCNYCDFLSAQATEADKARYVEALIREIESYEYAMSDRRVTSIYIGGGTPSILSVHQMERILKAIHETFHIEKEAEISIEINPGQVDADRLAGYYSMGINRLSLGLQSARDSELKELGRIHTYNGFLETYREVKRAGFTNINVDLMMALPNQKEEDFYYSLEKVMELEPTHISIYSLILEEGTPLFETYLHREDELPTEEEDRTMYWEARKRMEAKGFSSYEISNYAKPGYECKHNIGYWTGVEYLGIGLGAYSYMYETRFHGSKDLEEYITMHESEKEIEEISRKGQMEEFFFLGLRMTEGVTDTIFKERFNQSMWDIYSKELEELLEKGLLLQEGDRVYLSPRGVDLSNVVFVYFLK